MLGRDEIANMAIRDAREIVGFLDDADEISADGDEADVFLLALGVLALEQQRDELRRKLDEQIRGRGAKSEPGAARLARMPRG
jgi:hypothetical protein